MTAGYGIGAIISAAVFSACIPGAAVAESRLDAFPGAEGAGRYALGGRGGRVIKVTNLKDDGSGSLRAALRAEGPRTIIFEVSGTIELERSIVLKSSRVTIAGQTAPGDGITLKNFGLAVRADDVVIRYIRSRPGSERGQETDAISINAGRDIIIDHCSTSWATDETLTVSPTDPESRREPDRVTVQWSLVTESLNDSVHSKGRHGYGSLVRGNMGAQYSFHHNLWAHHAARMPRPGNYMDSGADPEGPLFDFRNNVFYNWGRAASGYNSDKTSVARYNFVGNYYLRGPDSSKALAFDEGAPFALSHFSENAMNHEIPVDPWSLVRFQDGRRTGQQAAFRAPPITGQTAADAFESVLNRAGASLARDEADQRVIREVRTGTGRLIDSVEDVGGWPALRSGTAPKDSDSDGMPDSWESDRGLDPTFTGDGIEDRDSDGYTNLEEYLNGLVERVR